MKSNRTLQTAILSLFLPLVLLTGCSTTPAGGPPASAADSPAAIPVLLGFESVRQQLQLTPAQCGFLDSLQMTYKARAKQIKAVGMASEDAGLRANWDLKKLRKQFNQQSLDLLTATQQAQLQVIQRQLLGGSLLSSPSQQQLLGLTPAQQQSLAAISANEQSQLNALSAKSQAGKISDLGKTIEQSRIQGETSNAMIAVLTPDQKKDWKILTGQKTGLPKLHDPYANTKSLFEGY
jgi:hypothetical protein